MPGPATINKLLEIYENWWDLDNVKDITEEVYYELESKSSLADWEIESMVKFYNNNVNDLKRNCKPQLTSITDKQAEELSKLLNLELNWLTRITDKQAEISIESWSS